MAPSNVNIGGFAGGGVTQPGGVVNNQTFAPMPTVQPRAPDTTPQVKSNFPTDNTPAPGTSASDIISNLFKQTPNGTGGTSSVASNTLNTAAGLLKAGNGLWDNLTSDTASKSGNGGVLSFITDPINNVGHDALPSLFDAPGTAGGTSLTDILGPAAAIGIPLIQGNYEQSGAAGAGALIGSIVPGIGTALGATLGSLLGGLFHHTPNVMGAGSTTYDPTSNQFGNQTHNFNGFNASSFKQTLDPATTALNSLDNQLGITWDPTKRDLKGTGQGQGEFGPFMLQSQKYSGANTTVAPDQYIYDMLKQGAGAMDPIIGPKDGSGNSNWSIDYRNTLNAPDTVLNAIRNSKATNLQGLLNDLTPYSKMGQGTQPNSTPTAQPVTAATQPTTTDILNGLFAPHK
jgi:hypothetical protein